MTKIFDRNLSHVQYFRPIFYTFYCLFIGLYQFFCTESFPTSNNFVLLYQYLYPDLSFVPFLFVLHQHQLQYQIMRCLLLMICYQAAHFVYVLYQYSQNHFLNNQHCHLDQCLFQLAHLCEKLCIHVYFSIFTVHISACFFIFVKAIRNAVFLS